MVGGDEPGEPGQDVCPTGGQSLENLGAVGLDRWGGRPRRRRVGPERAQEGDDGPVVDLQVELKPPGPGPAAESLVPVAGVRGQVDRTGREVEGVTVPVEDGEAGGQAGQERVLAGLVGEGDGGPADLGTGRSEVDPERRQAPAEGVVEEGELGSPGGESLVAPSGHGTAHDHQAVHVGQVGREWLPVVDPPHVGHHPGVSEGVTDGIGSLGLQVLDDQTGRHGLILPQVLSPGWPG